MDEDKKTDELENQLEQATEQAQNEGSVGANVDQTGSVREQGDYNPVDVQNTDNQNQVNQNGGGKGISPDLGTAKEQMKEDGIEIL